jgi:hypothetical protein
MEHNRARQLPPLRVKLGMVVAGALLTLALGAGTAQACQYTGAEQVFSRWGDPNAYVLSPDGGFEAGAEGWSLAGGARAVQGNESYYLHDADDVRSLSLPAGGSATSPSVCMSIDTPSLRMMVRNGGDPSSRLRVEARYSLLGLLRTNVVNDVTAGTSWTPSQQLSVVLGLSTVVGTLVPSAIQIRVRPLDERGQWQVDDLYVDPFARH